MLIECSTCSQCGSERSNPQAEARKGEPASRNKSELDSASLHYSGVAKPPEMLKPVASGEETFASSRWTLRGDWRWRVGKDKSRNLRGPVRKRSYRESDGLIVVKKRGNACGAKGTDCKCEMYEAIEFRLPCATTEIQLFGIHPVLNRKRIAYRKAGCGKTARPV